MLFMLLTEHNYVILRICCNTSLLHIAITLVDKDERRFFWLDLHTIKASGLYILNPLTIIYLQSKKKNVQES